VIRQTPSARRVEACCIECINNLRPGSSEIYEDDDLDYLGTNSGVAKGLPASVNVYFPSEDTRF
jgi:hypothetical protein